MSLDAVSVNDLAGKTVLFGFDYRKMGPFAYLGECPRSTTITIEPLPGEEMAIRCINDPNTIALFSEDTVPLVEGMLAYRPFEPWKPYPAGLYFRNDGNPNVETFVEFALNQY